MSDRLFIQFQDATSETVSWYRIADEMIQQSGHLAADELAQLQQQFPTAQVIALVPSNDCLISQVALPTRQRRQQLKAIPFVLEEQIADDIDSMHFAIGKRTDHGQLPVIAVAKNKMQHWQQSLDDAGFSISAMLPLAALLDAPDDAWSIFQLDDEFLVNQNGNCWTGQADEVAMMLQLSIEKIAEDDLPGLLFWGEEDAPGWVSGLGLEYSNHPVQEPQQALLLRFDHQQINLLQGEFAIQDDWHAGWSIWGKVAVISCIVILLKFILMGFDLYRLSEQQQYLKTEIERTYHIAAPGARIVDPKRQMQQLLTQRQGGVNQGSSFLMMLGIVGEGLTKIPDIQPTNMSYDGNRGEIRIDLLVSNLPVLDRLKDYLVNKGLSIEVGGASAQGSSYSGRLIIRSGS